MPRQSVPELKPVPRLLMGPGPINAYPQVLRALSVQLLGQFDPQFRRYMAETSALYRKVFQTRNRQTLMVDGTARAGIEAALVSLIEPGDRVLVLVFGRFGHLLSEIASRCGADVRTLETPWGTVFEPDAIERAVKKHRPKLLATCQGDTSTTMAQPLADIGRICARYGALSFVDATATLGGMPLPVDRWGLDVVSAGLQKCLGGPSGIAPMTISDRAAARIYQRRHIEQGLQKKGYRPGTGKRIRSNYFDLAMIMDYWSDQALNHHTEATSMLYAARECGRLLVAEGLTHAFARHATTSRQVLEGLRDLDLVPYGDLAHKMPNVTGVWIPKDVNGERARHRMLERHNIEIGTSFGPLHGKIWRIGAMGANARPAPVRRTLAALREVLRSERRR
ncbi:MAG: alanine--glyoxylate aminotransferase family protein [Betaproteobacteria bacterium]|nr:alanine--glyoxylate aminotransferase family protein [Betaproteobacteria bacterium]